jgi:ABC-type arginine transport system permease subunit
MSMIFFIYNLYLKYKKIYNFDLIIGETKENNKQIKRISFNYKIKFVFYIINSIISLTFTIISIFIFIIDEDDVTEEIKTIFNIF